MAFVFDVELPLDVGAFLGFYGHCGSVHVLESLHLFLAHLDYRYSPLLLRKEKEQAIYKRFFANDAPERVNVVESITRLVRPYILLHLLLHLPPPLFRILHTKFGIDVRGGGCASWVGGKEKEEEREIFQPTSSLFHLP